MQLREHRNATNLFLKVFAVGTKTAELCVDNLAAVLLFVTVFVCSLSSLLVLVFETPVLCTFVVNHARPITEFAERRTYFEKALVYLV